MWFICVICRYLAHDITQLHTWTNRQQKHLNHFCAFLKDGIFQLSFRGYAKNEHFEILTLFLGTVCFPWAVICVEDVCLTSAADPEGDVSLPIVISDGLLESFSAPRLTEQFACGGLAFAESVGGLRKTWGNFHFCSFMAFWQLLVFCPTALISLDSVFQWKVIFTSRDSCHVWGWQAVICCRL